MNKPERVRIPHDKYRFATIGRFADGTQFFAGVTGGYPGRVLFPTPEELPVKRWIAFVHLFDKDGQHLSTLSRLGGMDSEKRHAVQRAYDHLDRMLDELISVKGAPEYGDIHVRLFEVEVDEIVHGLFYEVGEGCPELESVLLEPQDIMFHPPWDSGEYST